MSLSVSVTKASKVKARRLHRKKSSLQSFCYSFNVKKTKQKLSGSDQIAAITASIKIYLVAAIAYNLW